MKIQIPKVNLKQKKIFFDTNFSVQVACARLAIAPCTALMLDDRRATLGQCTLAHLERLFLAVGILI